MDIYWEYEYGNYGNIIYNIPVWSFGTFFVFSYREESSQLTFIFFRGVGIPPTNPMFMFVRNVLFCFGRATSVSAVSNPTLDWVIPS